MTRGPIQLLVLGLEDPRFDGSLLAELTRLRREGVAELLDAALLVKDADGRVQRAEPDDLSPEEAAGVAAATGGAELGALLEPLLEGGRDPGAQREDDDVWFLDDAIPPGAVVVVLLLEHRWAVGLRDAAAAAGGTTLADAWLHPSDLAEIGLA